MEDRFSWAGWRLVMHGLMATAKAGSRPSRVLATCVVTGDVEVATGDFGVSEQAGEVSGGDCAISHLAGEGGGGDCGVSHRR